MTLYGLANYLHVLGAIGLGAVIVLEWLVVVRLRSTDSVEQARAWLSFTAVQQWAGPASMGSLLIAGVYMAATRWGGQGWISVALIALLLIAGFGALNGIRLRGLGKALAEHTARFSPQLQHQLRNPLFVLSLHARACIILGVVWLMIEKPDLTASALILSAAVVVGIVSALPAYRRSQPAAEAA
jgi:hypothetical protein